MTFQKKNVIIVFKASNSGLLTLTSFYRTGVKEMATQRGRKTASGRKRTNNRKRNTRRKEIHFYLMNTALQKLKIYHTAHTLFIRPKVGTVQSS